MIYVDLVVLGLLGFCKVANLQQMNDSRHLKGQDVLCFPQRGLSDVSFSS